MSVVLENTNIPEVSGALKIAADQLQRLHDALEVIQYAGNHGNPTAIWMQKIAAHAINERWPHPGDQP